MTLAERELLLLVAKAVGFVGSPEDIYKMRRRLAELVKLIEDVDNDLRGMLPQQQ